VETLSESPARPRPAGRNNFFKRVFSARKGLLAYIPLIIAAIALLIAAIVEAFLINVDILYYQCYATVFWFGAKTSQLLQAPQCRFILPFSQFHTLPLEYPPLTLAIFSPPLLAPERAYPVMFALGMALTAFFIYWLLLRYGPRGAGVVFAACLLVGCLATAFARFDLVPAALTLLCVVMAERKHWTLAYVALALGVLTKLYPIVLFPLLFLAEQRDQPGFFIPEAPITLKTAPTVFLHTIRNMRGWRWKNGLAFTGMLFGVTAFFWTLNSNGAFGSFSYLYLRPFEIESIGSVLLWLASLLGAPIGWITSFGSLNTVSPLAGVVSQVFFILLCVGTIHILIQQWKGKMDLVQASLAALLILIAASKVFSPQYLLWLIPLLAYGATGNRRVLLYWGGISVLTSLIYPVYFGMISMTNNPALVPGFLPAILLRNGLFVLLALAYLLNFLKLGERGSLPGPIRPG
jgi:hypothetical protein